jgi:hypothetical protein
MPHNVSSGNMYYGGCQRFEQRAVSIFSIGVATDRMRVGRTGCMERGHSVPREYSPPIRAKSNGQPEMRVFTCR